MLCDKTFGCVIKKVDGRKRIKLDVYFTAVGLIDISDEKELRELMEEIRRTA